MKKAFRLTEKDIDLTVKDIAAGRITDSMLEDQLSKYHTGKNGMTGHGFAAEDVNARMEKLQGKTVEKVGVSNEKNGADRITNGKQIQSKYCKTASKTIESAFGKDGMYRYKVRNGRPMALEVPRDQYDEAVEIMRQKIKDKKVKNVTNPDYAEKMVKKGLITYAQSLDVARFGNLSSVTYDAVTGSVSGLCSFGISGSIKYMTMIRNGATPKEALTEAFKTGGKSFGVTIGTHVAVAQAEKFINDVTKQGLIKTIKSVHLLPKEPQKKAAAKAVQKATAKKAVVNTAAKKVATRKIEETTLKEVIKERGLESISKGRLKTNAIVGAVTTAIAAYPDIKAAIQGKMTWRNCAENTAVNVASVTGGIAGSEVGAIIGTGVGFLIGGPPGAAGGELVGSMLGSIGGTIASSKAAQSTREWVDKKIDEKPAEADTEQTITNIDQ